MFKVEYSIKKNTLVLHGAEIKTIECYNSLNPSIHKYAADICLEPEVVLKAKVATAAGCAKQLQRRSAWQQLEEEGSEGWPNSSLCTKIKGEA